ncbi:MAG: plastocyanin/azurin family copper-binding protein [Nitrososphaera sp.]
MNRPVLIGIAAGILLAGLILSPLPSLFSAEAQNAPVGKTKKVTMIASEVDVQVAPDNALHPGGVMYKAMVFNGTIPGPVVSVDQGDTVEFTLINQGNVIHSMDFHAGDGTTQAVGANASEHGSNVQPGESVTWSWTPKYAGAFFYHCGADGLNGVWEHIANGMYGGVVVHPRDEQPAKEFYVVFGEIYSNNVNGVFTPANGTGSFDVGKFLTGNPDIVMTNGMAHKYVPAIGSYAKIDLNPDAQVFKVKPGELTRWYVINAGPNDGVAFHFISGILNVHDGSVQSRFGTQVTNDESWWIPPGSGSVIEVTFPDAGIYVGVDHAMNDVLKGAAFAVLATPNSSAEDHPAGTMVPPKGSDMVSGPPFTAGNATAGNATSGAAANATEGAASNATEAATEPAAQNQTLSVVNATGAGGNTTANLAAGAPDTAAQVGTNATSGGAATSGTNATTGAATTAAAATSGGAATTGPAATTSGATPATSGTNTTSGGANGAAATGAGTSVSIAPGSSSLTDTAFQPNPASVSVGDTVTWTNNDSQPHTVVSGSNGTPDGKFDSSPNFNPLIVPGGTFEHTFTEAGDYPYYCALHPNMVGTVSVS